MSRRFIIGASSVTFQLVLLGIAFWAILHKQDLIDWWRLQNYKPSATVQQLASAVAMVGRGRDLFYVSAPEVDDHAAFNVACTNVSEQGLVLGCYRAQHIYLYNVTDPQLNGVKEVTAAHEMLHAAYERLSPADKKRVNAMLDPIIKNMTDERILGLIQLYNTQEPGELYNEMHSVLGTEYRQLSPELEQYYSQYFANRSKIVGFSERYQAVFSASKTRITAADTQLNQLKSQVDTNNADLQSQQQAINQAALQMAQLRASNQIDTYNQEVPVYNDKVRQFNSLVTTTRVLVSQYNALVDQRNQEAAAQNNLYHSLDSRYQAMQPSGQ